MKHANSYYKGERGYFSIYGLSQRKEYLRTKAMDVPIISSGQSL